MASVGMAINMARMANMILMSDINITDGQIGPNGQVRHHGPDCPDVGPNVQIGPNGSDGQVDPEVQVNPDGQVGPDVQDGPDGQGGETQPRAAALPGPVSAGPL